MGVTTSCAPATVRLGRRADGRPVGFRWPDDMGRFLISGVTGSGKSGWVSNLLGGLAGFESASIIGIDMKGGLELGPWRDRLTHLACSPAEATVAFDRIRSLIEDRSRRLSTAGERVWRAELGSFVVLVIDELAELAAIDLVIDHDAEPPGVTDEAVPLVDAKVLRQAKVDTEARVGLLSSIARLGRALGVFVVCATQYPLAQVVPSELRAQLDVRIAGRLLGSEQLKVALGDGAASLASVEAIPPQMPGVAWVYGLAGFDVPALARAALVTDSAIATRVAATAHLTPRWADL